MTELTSPGRVLSGRYRLVEPLARGGMATVWVADDPVLSRRVAVKILRADLAEDDALRVRFRNEAIAAAKLSHPNIVATYDTGDDDGTAYIVMELVEGPTLRRILDDVGGLPVRDVLRIGEQVADALDAAHRAGLVHRDVKPANVLVPESGPVKVTDFGIAKAIGTDDLTRTGTVMGTARYLAPEQVNGHVTDARTDVYGLGLILFEMLCGHPPFGGDTEIATAMARLTTAAPSIRAERPDVPAELDDLVHRCLARHPSARFASAGAAATALERLRTQATTRARSAPSPTPAAPVVAPAPRVVQPKSNPQPRPAPAAVASSRRRASGWIWVVVALVVVLALAAVAIVLAQDDSGSGGPNSGSPSVSAGGPITIQEATSFDPPPGDNHEGDLKAGNVITGQPPPWSTEQYQQQITATKAGVGLRLQLSQASEPTSVTVKATSGGWSGSIYVAQQPESQLNGWGSPVAQGSDLGTDHTFEFDRTPGTYVLVWFTALPPGPNGYQLEISEITVA